MHNHYPTFLGLLLPCLLFVACAEQQEGAVAGATVDYESLEDSQQRQPEHALASFELHPGLGAQLFASEPTLINPTNLDIDERGRVWVCEAQNYRRFNHDHPARTAGDRILILEDHDHDGRADTAKVFFQDTLINAALGIAKLGDKVYVAASPNLLVLTDADGDDRPEKVDTLFTGVQGIDHDHGVHAVVFGPDGKLYFNFGNEGKQLLHKNGEPVRDIHGRTVEERKAFRQGMVFRYDPATEALEIMAHNFRNNFELALDAYGRMWQSDNDDDGNEATRINYVMDYGNYGFKDEVTGAAWQKDRVGMHPEIPKRHWHLNDPGVVPNLLQTGSGSPTGMVIYEGESLPEVFRGQMIHCEPGHNVVRSYPVRPAGAGYTAEIVPLMKSQDRWFRPSDVCVAPDGSLLVSDWYDAGVGGHLMADIERGRLYRLHAEGHERYEVATPDFDDPQAAIQLLAHPNQATRYLAYQTVRQHASTAPALRALIEDKGTDPHLRARAAWVLADQNQGMEELVPLLYDGGNAQLQELALRMARQYPGPDNEVLYSLIERAGESENAALLREAALGLRYLQGERADRLYARLANRYDGQDRWYLEALGFASDEQARDRYAAWLATEPNLNAKAARDLVWRSRAPRAVEQYEAYLRKETDPAEMARFFRALHFHDENNARPVVERAIFAEEHPRKDEMVRYALASVAPDDLRQSPRLRRRVEEIVPATRGSEVWYLVARNAELRSEAPILLDSALAGTDDERRVEAVRLAYELGGPDFYLDRYARADATEKTRMLDLARHLHTQEIMNWLKGLRADPDQPQGVRQLATRSLGNAWHGMNFLIEAVEDGDLPREEAEYTARVLSQAWRSDIRERAISWLAANRTGEAVDLDRVLAMEGDGRKGELIFEEYCQACHQVNGRGVRFGPNLDRIGEKLGRDGLLAAIAYPSQGIGFGYEGYEFAMNDGNTLVGYIESQTENELTVRMMGGVSKTVKKADISERRPLDESLMTAGLHTIMEQEELADLLAYLQALQLAR